MFLILFVVVGYVLVGFLLAIGWWGPLWGSLAGVAALALGAWFISIGDRRRTTWKEPAHDRTRSD